MSKKMNIFLMGYFGFGNAGDNFLLKKSVQFFKEQLPEAKLCVSYEDSEKIISVFEDDMSHISPLPFSRKHISQDLTYCNRRSFSEMIIALWRAHVLVFPGGSMLQDMTSFRSLFYYVFLLFSYRLFGKKVYLMSQGIGPLNRPLSKWLVLRVLNICHGVSLRDVKSVEALKALGVSEKRLMLASDLAYYNESAQEAPKQSKEQAKDLLSLFRNESEKKTKKLNLGLSLRDICITSYSESSLKFFLQSLKSHFIFLSCQDPVDRHQISFYNGLAGKITKQKELDALFSQKNEM